MSLLVPASEDELSDTGGSRLYVLPWEFGLGGDLARTLETKRHRRFFVCLFVWLFVGAPLDPLEGPGGRTVGPS